MQDVTEATLRAVIDRDIDAYRAGVETLQPDAGPSGKTVLAIYLSKAALHVRALRDPEFEVTQATLDRAKRPPSDHPELGCGVRGSFQRRGVSDALEPLRGSRRVASGRRGDV